MQFKWQSSPHGQHQTGTELYAGIIMASGQTPTRVTTYRATVRERRAPYAILAVECIISVSGAKRWIEETIKGFHARGVGTPQARSLPAILNKPRPHLRPPLRHHQPGARR